MSQEQFSGSRHAIIVTGEVLPADDETTSSSPEPQQTYLHKVAGARAPAHAGADAEAQVAAEAGHGAEGQDKGMAADDSPTVPDAVIPDEVTPDAVTPDEVTPDAVIPDEVTPDAVTPGTVTPGAVTPGAVTPGAVTPGAVTPGAVTPGAVTPGAVTPGTVTPGEVTPDTVTPDAVTPEVTPDAERGRHRAEEPAPDEPEPASAVPQARRPGDEAVPSGTEGNLLADGPGIREQWMRIQAQFVDDPRAAVTEAADIIMNVTALLEAAVRERQQILRDRWDGNGGADTETLRVLMQQYRALLERLAAL